ncbi:hypothetical protein IMZ48_06595 [Candidatus Bathyarchaeota archaeon]|nr:hypothetical protein [Candidatus Bathyarchaeota archaeon]
MLHPHPAPPKLFPTELTPPSPGAATSCHHHIPPIRAATLCRRRRRRVLPTRSSTTMKLCTWWCIGGQRTLGSRFVPEYNVFVFPANKFPWKKNGPLEPPRGAWS